jgi:hypothetical protein
MRADYVLYSQECLERRVVGKCCSNVLCSLHAYGVPPKAVRTCVCVRRTIQGTCIAHDTRSHTYNRVRRNIHPCIRAYMPTYRIQTRVHAFLIPVHNAIVYTMHKHASLLRTHASRLCAALTRVFGASCCGQMLQQCAALPPRLCSYPEGCTHMRATRA